MDPVISVNYRLVMVAMTFGNHTSMPARHSRRTERSRPGVPQYETFGSNLFQLILISLENLLCRKIEHLFVPQLSFLLMSLKRDL